MTKRQINIKSRDIFGFLKAVLQSVIYIFKNRSFSQLGEDLVISNHIEWLGYNLEDKGDYLDIGCYHPHVGSNTHLFYQKGARGVNVDIGKSKNLLFKIFRPRDIFVNAAVVPDTLKSKRFNFTLNGYGSKIDRLSATENPESNDFLRIIGISNLLETYTKGFFKNWSILTIDAEGMDCAIIESINFHEYPFTVIAFEMFHEDFENKIEYSINNSTHDFLKEYGYILQSVCGPTYIYLKKSE